MASKQELAKKAQNYRDKPEWPECRNCKHFISEKIDVFTEKNMWCNIGMFKVMKLGTCDSHEPMPKG